MTMATMKQDDYPLHLTVVCPVYNEQSVISLFSRRRHSLRWACWLAGDRMPDGMTGD